MVDPASERTVPDHVALIGLMGSGKSTVGTEVAALLGRPLVDVDDVIEAHTGMTVRQLWERGGEVAYRPLERDVVVHVLSQKGPDVLAVPGGAAEDHVVQLAFEAADVFTVWLWADVAILAERVQGSRRRPLLGDDLSGLLREQSTARAELYRRLADVVLDVDHHSVDELAASVVAAATRART
ncbi:MAG: aroK [Acidimicrobiales bacterium]|nr:aroK [Acidimicrobiales bacterium]